MATGRSQPAVLMTIVVVAGAMRATAMAADNALQECGHHHTVAGTGKIGSASGRLSNDDEPSNDSYRWTATAKQPAVEFGARLQLTFSFVPDGTLAAAPSTAFNTEPEESVLYEAMDAEFPGGMANFERLVREAAASWSNVADIVFEEVDDDGADVAYFNEGTLPSGGEPARGDIRFCMRSINGTGVDDDGDGTVDRNVWASAFFPHYGGDIVLDVADLPSFADETDDFRVFRNLLAHEIGHALGLEHVTPQTDTRLMEPRMSRNFDGPQPEDVAAINALYGNAFPLDEIFDDTSSDQDSIDSNIDDESGDTGSDIVDCDASACGVGCSAPMMFFTGFAGSRRRHRLALRRRRP